MNTAARLPWYLAGPFIGLLIIAVRAWANRPLGALGGYIDATDSVRSRTAPGFRAWLLVGTLLGGALWALTTRGSAGLSASFGLPLPPWALYLTLASAGAVMGFGARMAGGCTSGHGLCGVGMGSPASFVSTATFFLTAVAVAFAVRALTGAG